MVPDAAGRVDVGVDKVLVGVCVVILAEPAGRKGAGFVFHAAAVGRGDAIAGFVGNVEGV